MSKFKYLCKFLNFEFNFRSNIQTNVKDTNKVVDYVVDDISPYHWTPDMRKYYNTVSKKEARFSVDRLKNTMSNGKHLWRVEGCSPLIVKNRNTVCFHCGQYGHQEKHCRVTKCYMCGNDGHKVKYCPHRKCLTVGLIFFKFQFHIFFYKCGMTTPSSYVAKCAKCADRKPRSCPRCKFLGHSLIDCTDHWRRFHNVTVLQRIDKPSGQVYKDCANLWCCNCGRKGLNLTQDILFIYKINFRSRSRAVLEKLRQQLF